MIRTAIGKVLGCGCDSHEPELAALRREVQVLRSRILELERLPAPSASVARASSYAQAAQAMAHGQQVRLELGAPVTQPEPPAPVAAEAQAGTAAGTLVVELEDCIACGTCVEYSPEAFELSTDGRARVVSHTASADQVAEAMEACPTQCIRWQD